MEHGESLPARKTGGGTAEARVGPEGETGERLRTCRRQDSIDQTKLSRAVVLWPLANHTSNTLMGISVVLVLHSIKRFLNMELNHFFGVHLTPVMLLLFLTKRLQQPHPFLTHFSQAPLQTMGGPSERSLHS